MAELKGSPSAAQVVLFLAGLVIVGTLCSQMKGSQDGCEATGGRPHGLECVREEQP